MGAVAPEDSSQSESSRTNSRDPSRPQTGPRAPGPAAVSGRACEPSALTVHSLLVASHRAIQDGVKSARPFGPNGPDADSRAKAIAVPLGDQDGSTETRPDGCGTGVQRPVAGQAVGGDRGGSHTANVTAGCPGSSITGMTDLLL